MEGSCGMDSSGYDRDLCLSLTNSVMDRWIPEYAGEFLTSSGTISF